MNSPTLAQPDSLAPLLSFADVRFQHFYRWDDPMFDSVIASVPLGFKTPSYMPQQDEFPGERRMAAILGARLQGNTTSYDLVMTDELTGRTTKLEVKGLQDPKPSTSIQVGTKGKQAYESVKGDLVCVVDQMLKFVEHASAVPDTIDAHERLQAMLAFVQDLKHRIHKGEIPKGVLKKLAKAVSDAACFKQIWPFAKNLLSHAAFDPGVDWVQDWMSSIDVEAVFQDVSALVICTPLGFYMIEHEQLKRMLRFERISRWSPRFVVDHTRCEGFVR